VFTAWVPCSALIRDLLFAPLASCADEVYGYFDAAGLSSSTNIICAMGLLLLHKVGQSGLFLGCSSDGACLQGLLPMQLK